MSIAKKQFPLRLSDALRKKLALACVASGSRSLQAYIENLLEYAPDQIARLKQRVRELEAQNHRLITAKPTT